MKIRATYPLFLRILQRRSALLLLALYTAAALGSTAIPLLNTLGYESALLYGLLSAWIGAMLPLSMLRIFRRLPIAQGLPVSGREQTGSAGNSSLALVFGRWLHLSAAGMTLLLVPMAVLTVNAAFVRNCSMLDGALFWLLIPFMTVAFSAAVLIFLETFLGRRAVYAYFVLLGLLLLQPFVQIYSQPQLYAYNHVFGMFLGLSWDQAQPPFLTLLLYRLSTLSYIGLLLAVSAALLSRRTPSPDGGSRRTLVILFLPSLAGALLFTLFSTQLGFTNSSAHLRAELGSEYRLGNIRIVYDASTLDSAEVRRMAEEHLFQLERVSAELGVNWTKEITSYIYPDRATKRRLLGTESSDLARPWRAEVHLSADSWAETIKHELVHVVAGSFGPYLFRAPFVRVLGLTEGLAMAVEWSWGNRTLHEFCAGMLAQGILPHVRSCIGTAGFATNSSSVGYVASGSVTRWLIDSLGVKTIRRAYAGDNLEAATGMDYDEMNRRWRIFLGGIRRAQPDSIAVAYAFRYPSLFSAVCPRVITERNRDAGLAIEARQPARALALYRTAEMMAPNNRSAFGVVRGLYELRRWDSVVTESGKYLSDSNRAASLYPLLLWQGAAQWEAGDSAAADRSFSKLIVENLPGWPTPFAARMLRALRRGRGDSLKAVVTGMLRWDAQDDDSLRLLHLRVLLEKQIEDPVIVEEFMRAAAVDSIGRNQALNAWRQIEDDPAPDELRLFAVRLYYQERNWPEAQRLLRHLLNEPLAESVRNQVIKWLARCAWQLRREQK
ncbi:MAG: hypothetical protein WAV84_12025 [Bacteroidota bacterium]